MRRFYIIEKYKDLGVVKPKRATNGSAGYDLASIEDITINPKEIKMIPTGLKVSIPTNEVLLVFPRSSLALKKSLTMANNVGVIDADYFNNPNNEGHIMVPLINLGDEVVTVLKGERIAQGIFIEFLKTVDDKAPTIQRIGGFGSSDRTK